MAEERRGGRPEERPEEAPKSAPPEKKKVKRGKGGLIFLLLLLACGIGAGLHFSGLWDARPTVWGVVPKIPYIGGPLSRFFKIPEQYTLTVAERRAFELEEWQKRLDARERSLTTRESEVEVVSGDLALQADRVARQAGAATQSAPRKSSEPDEDPQKKMFDQVVKAYRDMSPRNAAAIVEQLREPLAVELLQKLPADARSSILGKVNPQKAARLTELMASGQ